MPVLSSVVLTPNSDGTYNLQIGPYGYQGNQADLTNRNFDIDQLANTLRLAHLIGNYGSPDSREFIDAVNNTLGGVKLADATYFITSVANNPDGTITIGTAPTNTGVTVQTFTGGFSSLTSDTQDSSVVVGGVKSFLRLAGYTSLTPAAVAAVNARQFWY